MSNRPMVLVLTAGLLLGMAACGGDDGTADDTGTTEAVATTSESEPTSVADPEALCRVNEDLIAFSDEELAAFEPGLDAARANGVVDELAVRIDEMSELAPDDLGDDLARYGEAITAILRLNIEADFVLEDVPQAEIDAFIAEHPDLNLFESNPVEDRIRTWFEENCTVAFAF